MFLPLHLYTSSGSDQKSTDFDRLRNTGYTINVEEEIF